MTAAKYVGLIIVAWSALIAVILVAWRQHRAVCNEIERAHLHDGAAMRQHDDGIEVWVVDEPPQMTRAEFRSAILGDEIDYMEIDGEVTYASPQHVRRIVESHHPQRRWTDADERMFWDEMGR